MQYLSLDIGGTYIKYGVTNETGEFSFESKCSTDIHLGVSPFLRQIKKIIQSVLKSFHISGVAICTTGVVNADGEIIYAGDSMPDYIGTNLKEEIETTYDIRTNVINDVNAVALGVKWKGAGKGESDFFCMTLGTGIGGALVINHSLYTGYSYKAGEIGYMMTGGATTFENKAATSELVARAKKIACSHDIDGVDIFELYKNNEEEYVQLMHTWADELATGIANIIFVLDPKLIIIGGAISKQGDHLIELITNHLHSKIPPGFLNATIVPAVCGNKAGMLGAVYGFIQEFS